MVYGVARQLDVADWFLVVTCLNRSHARALEGELHLRSKAVGERHQPIEGGELHWWVVMDFGDVVVHLLQPEARAYYDLDRLYTDCPQLDWASVGESDGLHTAEA